MLRKNEDGIDVIDVRHGDVLVDRCDEAVDALMEKRPSTVLAEGEVTGHAHRMDGSVSSVSSEAVDAAGRRHLTVVRDTPLTHEEHEDVVIEEGEHRTWVKRAYSPDGWRQVVD